MAERVQEHRGPLTTATMIAVGILVALSSFRWYASAQLRQELDRRATQVDARMTQLAGPAPAAPAPVPAAPEPEGEPVPEENIKHEQVTVGDSPFKGPASAPIVIAEFSDFQCEYCGQMGARMDRLRAIYGDNLRVVWKNMPLAMHPDAPLAHLAAMAAHEQGRFWEYHDLLFQDAKKIKLPDLLQYARQLKLDMPKFLDALNSKKHQAAIDADVQQAESFSIDATPSYLVNGRYFWGTQPIHVFAMAINAEHERLRLPLPPGALEAAKPPPGAPPPS